MENIRWNLDHGIRKAWYDVSASGFGGGFGIGGSIGAVIKRGGAFGQECCCNGKKLCLLGKTMPESRILILNIDDRILNLRQFLDQSRRRPRDFLNIAAVSVVH